MKKIFLFVLPGLVFGGCLGDLMEFSCMMSGDPDHCYQAAAIQEADPQECSKVTGEGFVGSNPPRDKCHLLIAENTGDPSVCSGIEGGLMSYDPNECLKNVLKDHDPSACTEAKDEAACRTTYAQNGRGCGEGYVFKGEKCLTVAEAEKAEGGGLSNAAEADVKNMVDAAKGKYMDLLEADIDGETDPDRLAGLQAYKEFLGKAGETMETVETSLEKLNELKKIFIDSYDPSMAIENMSVSKELDPGLVDKIKEKLFGTEKLEGIERETVEAENSLKIYEAMLKQQGDNDFLKKDRLGRLGDTIASKFKDEVTEKLTESAKEIAEGVTGTAFGAVTHVGEALQAFQDEAQKQMFLGLARAYNRRREALEQERPGLSSEEVHQLTVDQVKDDPYRDNTNLGFIKHGNILLNLDCQDDSNPLCVDNRVWWTAMDKTFRYNKKNR